MAASWKPIKIGAGGFITGYSASDDGATRVIRTDTYGDYKWDGTQWVSMLTYASMGPSVAVSGANNYVYECVVAPGDATRLYRWWSGKVYKSDDGGATWSVTAYATASDLLQSGGLAFASRLFGKNIAVKPTDKDTVLVGSYINGLRRSTNGGGAWSDIATVPPASWSSYRVNGAHSAGATVIAVNTGTLGIPANSIVYFTETGANPYVVTVGLASGSGNITVHTGLSTGIAGGQVVRSPGGIHIAFDPSAPTTVYAASYGNGVYRSTDSGATFSSINGSLTNKRIVVGPTGIVYTLADGSPSVIQKYTGGSWTDISPGQDFDAIAADPNNAARIVANGGGFLSTTINTGTSWNFTAGAYWGPNCLLSATVPFSSQMRTASDVPWLAWTQECIISVSDIVFDPVLPGSTSRLWFTSGVGVWYYDFGSTTAQPAAQISWTSQNTGIEQLVANNILSPPGGTPNFFSWDRPQFYLNNPDVYPSTHGPNALYPIIMGWSADYVAAAPATLVANINWFGTVDQSGISTDGGQTWTKFSGLPSNATNGVGGNIAAASASNFLWCMQGNNAPSYSQDGGASWTKLTSTQIPSLPADGTENGFGFAYYLNSKYGAADRVNANTFYLYNYLTSPDIKGIYRSTNGGVAWTRIFDQILTPGASPANAKLMTVPGYAGHMFFTYGPQGDNSDGFGGFWRSTNGVSATAGTQVWTAIAGIDGVHAFGFGAIAPGGDYPTVYIAGWRSGVYSIYRGDGTAAQWAAGGGTGTGVTWTDLAAATGGFPLGNFDLVKAVEGDANTYGKVYVGFTGSGGAYYADDAPPPPPPNTRVDRILGLADSEW